MKTFYSNLMNLSGEEIRTEVQKFKDFLLENFDKDFVGALRIDTHWIGAGGYSDKKLFWYSKDTKIMTFTKYKSRYSSTLESNEINFDEKKYKKFKEIEAVFIPNYKKELEERYKTNIENAFYKKERVNMKDWVELASCRLKMSACESKWFINEDFKIIFREFWKITLENSSSLRNLPIEELIVILQKEKAILEEIIKKYNNTSVWDYISKEEVDEYIKTKFY